MVRIIADDKIPFLKGVLEPYAEVKYIPGHLISTNHLNYAEGLIIRTRTKCNRQLLENSSVRFIATATIGFDHIDTEYCKGKGINWTNAPGCNSGSVQQYIASVLMHIEMKEQRPINELTLGIIGVGHVGKKIEKLALALGMKVILNDPPRARTEGPSSFTDLDDLLKQSDIITLHVPLNRDGKDITLHMADSSFFKKMNPQAWFINASRGEICKTDDLLAAHKNGIVKDMVLDVWENEPDIDTDLLHQCFIGTPHIAGYSLDGKANGTAMAVQSCSQFFGFSLNKWYPENLRLPPNALIDLTTERLNDNENISKAILKAYTVCEDDSNLRASPTLFEKLRGEYPLRREFNSYSIKLDKSNVELARILNEIGFNILESNVRM
jgi:erythronate-4-phosphate dehydrogenase